jgi:hypothetical protein
VLDARLRQKLSDSVQVFWKREICGLTMGRTGYGAQQYRVSLIRPNRASSWNINRIGLGVVKLFTI